MGDLGAVQDERRVPVDRGDVDTEPRPRGAVRRLVVAPVAGDVGRDLRQAGDTPGAQKGLFEFCSITSDPVDESKFPLLKSANADERIIVTLTKADGVVSVSGCEPLTARR